MHNKPFRYCSQLLNRSLFLIVTLKDILISAQAGAKRSCGQKISMEYQSSSQSSSARTCMVNNNLLPLQAKCFNLLALKHWFMSEQSSMCRRKAGQPVPGCWRWLLQGARCKYLFGNSVGKSGAAFKHKTLLSATSSLSCEALRGSA